MITTKQQTWADVLTELVRRSAIPANAHRILLYGPPGTGKSSWAGSAFAHVERVTLYAQMPPEDLVGSMALVARNGGTETVWQDGPAVRAMRRGSALVIDEIDQHSPELRCALHAILTIGQLRELHFRQVSESNRRKDSRLSGLLTPNRQACRMHCLTGSTSSYWPIGQLPRS